MALNFNIPQPTAATTSTAQGPTIVPGSAGMGRWAEDMTYRQQEGVDLVNALRNAYQPTINAQNAQLANSFRRRGLGDSGMWAQAQTQQNIGQTQALDAQALNVAQFLSNEAQQARGRVYGQHMNELNQGLAAHYRPKQKSGLAGALGGIVGNMIAPGIGGAIGSSLAGGGGGGTGGFIGGMTGLGQGGAGFQQGWGAMNNQVYGMGGNRGSAGVSGGWPVGNPNSQYG
ncbi:MAG: hypothetical protein GY833_16635 [Aestuariibacter sp.]|nr:hypothetical protein [Aestuariibacter sp.]